MLHKNTPRGKMLTKKLRPAKKRNSFNDAAALAVGYKYAVLSEGGKCLGLFSDVNKANKLAISKHGKIVHVTASKDSTARTLAKNGLRSVNDKQSGVKSNPIDDFEPPDDYQRPESTWDKIRESFGPGLRIDKKMKEKGLISGTDWPVPETVEIPVPRGLNYQPHQKSGIIAMARRGNVLLADEQGLGKTIEVAGYMNLLKPTKTLIVAPMVMSRMWVRELNKWLVVPRKMVIMEGSKFLDVKFTENRPKFTESSDQDNPKYDILIAPYSTFSTKERVKKTQEELEAEKADEEAKIPGARRKKAKEFVFNLKKNRISAKALGLCKKIERNGLDLIILDEVHKLKNVETKLSMAFFGEPINPETGEHGYNGIAMAATKKIFCTGTPIVGSKIIELYHWLHALDNKNFISEGMFEEYFGVERKVRKGASDPSGKNRPILGIKMRDSVMIRRLAEDVLDLPDMVVDKIDMKETDLVVQARQLLEEAIKDAKDNGYDYVKELEEKFSDSEATANASEEMENFIEALTDPELSEEERSQLAGVQKDIWKEKRGKLTQRVKIDFKKIAYARRILGEAKAYQTRYILEQIDKMRQNLGGKLTKKMVLFYHHSEVEKIILAQLKDAGYEKDQIAVVNSSVKGDKRLDAVDNFMTDPNIEIFLGTIQTAGAGITLTSSNVCVFIEQDWTPGHIQQSMKRIHRIGQTHSICISLFAVVNRSLDNNMFKILQDKEAVQVEVLDLFPTARAVENYEDKYKEKELVGARFPLQQRYALVTAANVILKGMENDYGRIDMDKEGMSYNDIDILRYLVNQKANIRNTWFDESRFDASLPLIWKKRTKIKRFRLLEACGIPDSITGFQRGVFKSVREYDRSFNPFRYLISATTEARLAIMAQRRVEGRTRRQKEAEEVEVDEMEDLKRAAEFAEEDDDDGGGDD